MIKKRRKQKNIKNGSVKRCMISGKLIQGKEVLLPEYALEYVRSIGYIVFLRSKEKITPEQKMLKEKFLKEEREMVL